MKNQAMDKTPKVDKMTVKRNRAQIAKLIDYALLQPTLNEEEMLAGCRLARQYQVATVCVKPGHVATAYQALQGSSVLVSTVISFPHGNSMPAVKAAEAALAIEQGARELDMVCNIGAVKSAQWALVLEDIRAVVATTKGMDIPVKVILETAYLTAEEKVRVCQLAEEAGAAFVKTSTGFAGSGATVEDIRLMRATVGPAVGVKASGGIRTLQDVTKMVEAGANRIGTSSLSAILDELPV